MLLFYRLFVSLAGDILPPDILACFCSSLFAVRRCYPNANSVLIDFGPQAALLVFTLAPKQAERGCKNADGICDMIVA